MDYKQNPGASPIQRTTASFFQYQLGKPLNHANYGGNFLSVAESHRSGNPKETTTPQHLLPRAQQLVYEDELVHLHPFQESILQDHLIRSLKVSRDAGRAPQAIIPGMTQWVDGVHTSEHSSSRTRDEPRHRFTRHGAGSSRPKSWRFKRFTHQSYAMGHKLIKASKSANRSELRRRLEHAYSAKRRIFLEVLPNMREYITRMIQQIKDHIKFNDGDGGEDHDPTVMIASSILPTILDGEPVSTLGTEAADPCMLAVRPHVSGDFLAGSLSDLSEEFLLENLYGVGEFYDPFMTVETLEEALSRYLEYAQKAKKPPSSPSHQKSRDQFNDPRILSRIYQGAMRTFAEAESSHEKHQAQFTFLWHVLICRGKVETALAEVEKKIIEVDRPMPISVSDKANQPLKKRTYTPVKYSEILYKELAGFEKLLRIATAKQHMAELASTAYWDTNRFLINKR